MKPMFHPTNMEPTHYAKLKGHKVPLQRVHKEAGFALGIDGVLAFSCLGIALMLLWGIL